MALQVSSIGQYEIVEQIGRGGMATVYKARQPGLDRYVAIKVLPADLAKTEDFRTRFQREAKTIAKLRHRNILTIFEDGRHEDVLYLVMEYVEAGTLRDRLGWPQDLSYIVGLISQVGDALAHAHRAGVIHRDVKPGNILMAADDWPLLSDFGLAKMVEDSLHLTAGGASVGTPHYMSPEQAKGQPADHRSDIYSLGVVLYESITGQRPFGNENAVTVIYKQINDPIPSPRNLRSDLPKALEQVILKALEKSPEERYQKMEDFVADLQEAYPRLPMAAATASTTRAGGTATPPPSMATPVLLSANAASLLPSRKRKSRWRKVLPALLVALLAGVTLFYFQDSITPYIANFNQTFAAAAGQFTTPPAPPAATPTEIPSPAVTAQAEAVITPVPTTTAMPSPSPTLTASPTPSATAGLPSPTVASTNTPVPPTSTATAAPSPTSAGVTATALPAPPAPVIRVSESDGVEMVFVPAGEFSMGSHTLGDDEQPVHLVYLADFWIDRYEVTNRQFAQFVEDTGYQTDAEKQGWGWVWASAEWEETDDANWQQPRGAGSPIAGKMEHPVVLISWNDAQAYCTWAGKRLPTEAEWEKAARGPALESGYAWGVAFDSTLANTQESGLGDTAPIGTFSPQGNSYYGAADLTGNAAEWVADWYSSDYYSQSPANNPAGPANGAFKILRGGSWLFDEVYGRTAFRYNLRPDYTYDFAGFRCAGN